MGLRLGPGAPKAFRTVAGESLLHLAARAVCADDRVDRLLVAVPPDSIAEVAADLSRIVRVPVSVVAGGVLRQDSVANLLTALDPSVSHVLVHDAARPFVPPAMVARVLDSLSEGHPAVIPVVPVVDTVKEVEAGGNSTERVVATLDRSVLRAVQTPQGFNREVLVRAFAQPWSGLAATDEASLVERIGVPVVTVAGDQLAFKVTTPFDLAVADVVAGQAAASDRARTSGGDIG
jgi:2-C-methyl-D-erythritol 4-phosphate cytidylyltransferase